MTRKKQVASLLKVLLPLALGIFLIVYIYSGFSPEDRRQVTNALLNADYRWVALSFALGILSHLSRAHRWLLLIRTMGYQASMPQSFYSVMIGYLANMAFPRLGEVSRCGAMSRSTGTPFQKLFGSVMGERLVDLIILLSITIFTFWHERKILGSFANEYAIEPLSRKLGAAGNNAGFIVVLIVIGLILFFIGRLFLPSLLLKLRNFMAGFAEGLKSILQVKYPLLFVGHTLLIWTLYFLMARVCFYSLESVTDASLNAVLASFVMGSFGIIATQGGIGAYHSLVAGTLVLYGIEFADGFAFAWIAWSGQTAMILLTGFFSLIALPLIDKKNSRNVLSQSKRTTEDPKQDLV